MSKPRKGLLVYPEVPADTFWSLAHGLRLLGKKAAMPPLGLITLAALFPSHWDLALVDMNVRPLRDDDIRGADAVFVSAMNAQRESLAKVAAQCQGLGVPVVAGGPYPTMNPAGLEGVSHVVAGEVEDTFAAFLAGWEEGRAPRVFPAPETRPDISSAVVPRFDLLDTNAYASMSVQVSRGCPFTCEFCDIWKVLGNRPRLKAPETLLAELDALHALGWRNLVLIVDDNFIGALPRVKKDILPALLAWQKSHGFPYRFYTQAGIRMAQDPDLLEAMARAGFTEVFIGIETPVARTLKEMGKAQNLGLDMAQAVRTIQEHGMEVMAGFILGYDSDTPDIAERQIRFIEQAAIPRAMVGLLGAVPGTDLHRRLEKEGRILGELDGDNTRCGELNFRPRMGGEAVRESYRKVMGAIYGPDLKTYFDRCNRLLDTMGTPRAPARRAGAGEILMAARALPAQLFSGYGFEYAKFLARNLFKNPRSFSHAYKLGLTGRHFRAITQRMLEPGPEP